MAGGARVGRGRAGAGAGRAAAVLALVAAGVAAVGPARADGGPGALADRVQVELDAEAARALRWRRAWIGTFSGLAAAQLGRLALVDDRGLRAAMAVGAGGALLGVAGQLISPMPRVGRAARTLREAGDLPGDGRDALAVRLRADAAAAERAARHWSNHVLGLAVAGASGLVLWRVFDRPVDAALNAGVGVVLTELQIATAPARLLRPDGPRITLSPLGRGLRLAISFR